MRLILWKVDSSSDLFVSSLFQKTSQLPFSPSSEFHQIHKNNKKKKKKKSIYSLVLPSWKFSFHRWISVITILRFLITVPLHRAAAAATVATGRGGLGGSHNVPPLLYNVHQRESGSRRPPPQRQRRPPTTNSRSSRSPSCAFALLNIHPHRSKQQQQLQRLPRTSTTTSVQSDQVATVAWTTLSRRIHCDDSRSHTSCRRQQFSSLSCTSQNTPSSSSSSSNRDSPTNMTPTTTTYSFVDIGANLLDERFTHGTYFGKVKHIPDWDVMIERAIQIGITHIIVTAGTVQESQKALELVRTLRSKQQEKLQVTTGGGRELYFGCTIGVHPTRCLQEFVGNGNNNNNVDGNDDIDVSEEASVIDDESILQELLQLAIDGSTTDQSVCAIGEIGLDYDRLEFCPKDIQLKYLQKQLTTFDSNPSLHQLPLFLHNRNVGTDLLDILQQRQQQRQYKGVIHSFDDTIELAQEFIKLGFYIGLNGCSLKTKENLKVVQELPLHKILLETDCPYCEIKSSHAGYSYIQTIFEGKKNDKKFEWGKMVKGRNEPCQIIQVAEVIAGVKGIPVQEVADICYENSLTLYGWNK